MRPKPVSEMLLVRYLLGNLSEDEQVQVEDRAFADADYLEALEAAEADLIDAYVRGELSQPERRAFEHRFFTSPNRRQKVEFAKALARASAEWAMPERPVAQLTLFNVIRGWNPAFRLVGAFAVLVCIIGPLWLLYQNTTIRSRITVMEAQRQEFEAREQGLQQQLREEQRRTTSLVARQPEPAAGVNLVASLILLPGVSRSETRVEQLVLNPSAQIAHIEIEVEARDNYPRFRVELRTRRGEDVLMLGNLTRWQTSSGYAISFDVPTSALAAGEYELSLKGLAGDQAMVDVGFYYFGVRRP